MNMLLPDIRRLAGTYSFCSKCTHAMNCCARVTPDGEIDSPVIMSHEVRAIEKYSGIAHRKFIESGKDHKESRFHHLKYDSSGCFFFKNGKCKIYDVRPIDCRLFPFDIIQRGGFLELIEYKSVCPIASRDADNIEKARTLLPHLGEGIYEYATIATPLLMRSEYHVIGRINSSLTQSS